MTWQPFFRSTVFLCLLFPAMTPVHAQLAGPSNGGFENGLTGWVHQFGTESVTTDAHGGTKACRLTGDAAQGYGQLNSPGFTVEPGATYTLSSYVKLESGTGRYMVALAWLGGETQYSNAWAGSDTPADWTGHGGTFTAPAGKNTCVIILGVDYGTVALFDDISLTKVGGSPDTSEGKHWQVWAAPAYTLDQNLLLNRATEWAEARGLLRGLVLPGFEDFIGASPPWTIAVDTLAPVLAKDGVRVIARAAGLTPGSTGGDYAFGSLAMVGPGEPAAAVVLTDPIANVLQGARTAAPGGMTLAASVADLAGCVAAIRAQDLASEIILEVNLPHWTFDGHPSHFGDSSWSAGSGYDLKDILDAVLAEVSVAGIHAVNPYDYYSDTTKEDPEKVLALEGYVRSKGLPFGLVYGSGARSTLTNQQFHDQTIAMLQAYQQAGGFPDVFVLQSNTDEPSAYLPEKTRNTYMDTVRDFATEVRRLYPKAFPGEANDMLLLDNGTIKIGMDLKSGGAITYLSLSGVDDNIINIHDRGREIQQSYYAGDTLDRRSEGQSGSWSPWPWNPIQVGDYAGNSAEIIEAWIDGDVAFTRCIPMLWDMNNEPGQCYMDQWTKIEGNVAHIRNRLTVWRDPDDRWNLVAPRDQELPAIYTIADVPYLYTYVGDNPWNNGPLTEIDNDPNDGFIWDAFTATEHWAANVKDRSGNGWGLGVYNRESTRFLGGLAGTVGGGPYDASTAYISPLGRAALGRTSVYEYEYDLIVGTLSEIRQYVYAHPPENPNGWEWWQFNTDGNMEGWIANQHTANVEVSGGALKFDVTGIDPIFNSPAVAIIASETPYIHVRMKNGTPQRSMQFFWTNSRGGPGTPGNDITLPISANDETFQDYVIDMTRASGWTGVISALRFDPVGGGDSGHIEVDYIAAWPTADTPVEDTTPPVITLTGDAAITMDCDQVFHEPGYTATDDTDGDITALVVVGGDALDGTTPEPGEYTITYDVSDRAGNAASRVTRRVTVTGNCPSARCGHAADTNGNCVLELGELLRCIQFYNARAYHCAATADGYAPGPGDHGCTPHTADYAPQDWTLGLDEVMRLVQFYNSESIAACEGSEDGYCPGA